MHIPSQKNLEEKLLLRALAGEATSHVPFWLMRQAGRYLPEYRDLRKKAGSFLDLCFNPEFAAEVTLQPVRRFDMDAAILFSDILVVPYALGQSLDFVEGGGPRLGALPNLGGLHAFDTGAFDKKLQPVFETVRRVRRSLGGDKALIGFAGAPWTVACYMIQGQGDGEFTTAKKFAFSNPLGFDKLMDVLVTATSRYLIEQIRQGADTVQIFDSWAGLLPDDYFERWVIAPTRKIVDKIHQVFPGFPVIGFPHRAGQLYRSYAEKAGVSAVGLDQYFPLKDAVHSFGHMTALQGNLDPVFLLAGGKTLEKAVHRVLKSAEKAPFIFNLGHGVIKETPPEHVDQLAKIIKNVPKIMSSAQKLAVVLFNLGGPDSAAAIRPFLFNFFMDKNIIPLPKPLRYGLAKWVSWQRGGGAAKESYGHLGGASPLLANTVVQAEALERVLQEKAAGARVFVSMRYWHPLAEQTVREVAAFRPDKIVLLPLYPQFSTTTSFSSLQNWSAAAKKSGLVLPTSEVCCYPSNPGFVAASAELIRSALQQAPQKTRLLFSAHGLPERVIRQGDPYQHQCEQTVAAITKELNVPGLDWQLCYQSRVGRLPWTGPSIESALQRAAADKVGVVVYPSAFVSEHVETLVEIDVEHRRHAQQLGISYFAKVPTVGTHHRFIEGLRDLVLHSASGAARERACPGRFRKCYKGKKND